MRNVTLSGAQCSARTTVVVIRTPTDFASATLGGLVWLARNPIVPTSAMNAEHAHQMAFAFVTRATQGLAVRLSSALMTAAVAVHVLMANANAQRDSKELIAPPVSAQMIAVNTDVASMALAVASLDSVVWTVAPLIAQMPARIMVSARRAHAVATPDTQATIAPSASAQIIVPTMGFARISLAIATQATLDLTVGC